MLRPSPHPDVHRSLKTLDPRRWGCEPAPGGWTTYCPGLGEVRIARLGWQHALANASANGVEDTSALSFLVALQAETWGMPPAETVPANLLAVLADTGGSVLVAYRPELGWTPAGWLGFAIAMGSSSGVLVSHMLGVHDDARGGRGIGWLLKVVQAYEAVRTGHHAATWTFDPMRGANARLNLTKLGAVCATLVIDKYGPLKSSLYGDVPSDRLIATWNLTDPLIADRLAQVHAGHGKFPPPAEVLAIQEIAAGTAADPCLPRRLRYAIPADIDRLTREQPAEAARWRGEMRSVLGTLLATDRAEAGAYGHPPETTVERTTGSYRIDGFASMTSPAVDRANHYLLSRRTAEEFFE